MLITAEGRLGTSKLGEHSDLAGVVWVFHDTTVFTVACINIFFVSFANFMMFSASLCTTCKCQTRDILWNKQL